MSVTKTITYVRKYKDNKLIERRIDVVKYEDRNEEECRPKVRVSGLKPEDDISKGIKGE